MPWAELRLKGRIRFKLLQLDKDAEQTPRYFWPDLKDFLVDPTMANAIEFTPVFVEGVIESVHVEQTDFARENSSPLIRISAAASFLDVCRDTIESRMIPWQTEADPYRIRSSRSEIQIGRNLVRLCYRPDVVALLNDTPG